MCSINGPSNTIPRSFRYINRYQSQVPLIFQSKTIVDVMMSISIYPILDESSFVRKKENHVIHREIYGDPIYDV